MAGYRALKPLGKHRGATRGKPIAAADPRLSAIATISGVRALTGLHTPALLICGQQDTVVPGAVSPIRSEPSRSSRRSS